MCANLEWQDPPPSREKTREKPSGKTLWKKPTKNYTSSYNKEHTSTHKQKQCTCPIIVLQSGSEIVNMSASPRKGKGLRAGSVEWLILHIQIPITFLLASIVKGMIV